MTDLVGQSQPRVKFYPGILFIGLGPAFAISLRQELELNLREAPRTFSGHRCAIRWAQLDHSRAFRPQSGRRDHIRQRLRRQGQPTVASLPGTGWSGKKAASSCGLAAILNSLVFNSLLKVFAYVNHRKNSYWANFWFGEHIAVHLKMYRTFLR